MVTPAPTVEGARDLVALADIVVPNEGEAIALTGAADSDAAALALSAAGATAVVTLGSRGAVVAQNGRIVHRVASRPAAAVDTTAAGDTFVGALVAWLAGGATLPEALAAASAAAAITVTRRGAVDGIPTRAEIVEALAE